MMCSSAVSKFDAMLHVVDSYRLIVKLSTLRINLKM